MADTSREHPIKGIMRNEGRKLAWLARETGYSNTYVIYALAGRWNPSHAFRQRCAEVLGRSIEDLFYETSGPVVPRKNEQVA